MVCQQLSIDPVSLSFPFPFTIAPNDAPDRLPSTSFDWDDRCSEQGHYSCSCASTSSPLDLPSSLPDSHNFGYQAWPWAEPLISSDALLPSGHDLDSMTTAYSLPSWGGGDLQFDSLFDQCLALSPPGRGRLYESPELYGEAGHSSESLGSPSQSDNDLWEGNSTPDNDSKLLSRFTARPSKWVTKKRDGVSKAAAHNLIEKKYRSNLNDKMTALRDTIPTLRKMAEKAMDDPDPQEPSRKLNKAYILTEAKDYVICLQKRNEWLGRREKDLEARIKAFEMLSRSRCNKKRVT